MKKSILKIIGMVLTLAVMAPIFWAVPFASAATGTRIVGLKTDYMDEPVGIDTKAPVFSWQMESSERNMLQESYRIVVRRDAPDGETVWDSGKITDGRSVNIAYAGEALLPQTVYYWTAEVWDNQGGRTVSAPGRFETGLFEESNWSSAEWIKHSAGNETEDPDADRDYVLSLDFQIVRDNMGVIFSTIDPSNYFMWAVNTSSADHPYLRRHIYINGAYTGVTDIPLPAEFTKASLMNAEHNLTIRREGDIVISAINGVEVDRYTDVSGGLTLGEVGFRVHNESARFDNVSVTVIGEDGNTVRLKTGFDEENPFDGGQIVTVGGDKKLLVDSNSEYLVFEKKQSAEVQDLFYVYSADFQITRDNMGLIFAAKDSRNFFMWAVNTTGAGRPYLRRHVFVGGSATGVTDIPLPTQFTASSLKNSEHHIEITVAENNVTTKIDDVFVDSYIDNTGYLCEGYYGFRFYNEGAHFDNVTAINYQGRTPVVMLEAGFDDGINPFDGGEIVDVGGNKKLSISSNSEYKVFETRISAATSFRKDFTAAKKQIESARVYYSSLGVSDLYLNGERVGTPTDSGKVYDELKPGWTDYDDTAFYLTYDVTDMIKPGENAIGAEVASGWYNGVIAVRGGSFYSGQPNGLRLKLEISYSDGTSDTIVTDKSWSTARDGSVTYADIYNGETYDARKDSIAVWSKAGYNDKSWQTARRKTDFTGKVIAAIGSTVQERSELTRTPVSTVKYTGIKADGSTYGEIDGVTNPEFPFTLSPGETVIFDMGQNMVGWEKFTVKGEAGTAVNIHFGEILNDSGEASRKNDGPKGSVYNANYLEAKASGQYIMSGADGGETYNPRFTFYGFRYVEITATREIEILNLEGAVVGNANEENSSFETSDPSVNQLYSNIIWGQRCNFLSVPTDCPQRNERLGWTADTHIFSRVATYNADVAGFYRKWLQDMRDSQFDNGAYPDVAPNTHIVGGGNGGWAEAGIIVPYNVWLMYGDAQLIEEHFDSMERFMDYLASCGDATWKYNGGGAASGDWVSPELNDDSVKRYISVTYYAYSAKLMAEMAAAIGKTDEAAEYAALFDDIKAEYNTRYVNSDGTLKVATQTTYLLALKLDLLATQAQFDTALSTLLSKIENNGNRLSTGFIGTSILNQTLSDVGANDMAYTLLLQHDYPSWLYSVDQGATTIWENWDSYTVENGFKDPGMNSFNHYAYGAIGEWMYRYVAGIEADDENPGFKHFILQPTPDTRSEDKIPEEQTRLTSAKATFESMYGEIASGWVMGSDGRICYNAKVPANSTATLYLPVADDSDLITEGGLRLKNCDGITIKGITDGIAEIELGSGEYSFCVLSSDMLISNDYAIDYTAKTITVKGNVDVAEFLASFGEGRLTLLDGETVVTSGNVVDGMILSHDRGAGGDRYTIILENLVILGDVDGNGGINVSDVVALRQAIMRGEHTEAQLASGDLNKDGQLNVSDVVALRQIIMNGSGE